MKLCFRLLLGVATFGPMFLLSSCASAYSQPKFESTRAGNDNTYPSTYRAPASAYETRRTN